jgi:hypothetical protein
MSRPKRKRLREEKVSWDSRLQETPDNTSFSFVQANPYPYDQGRFHRRATVLVRRDRLIGYMFVLLRAYIPFSVLL